MDAKTGYSDIVKGTKKAAADDRELRKIVNAGHKRKDVYGVNWISANINDVVNRFAPGVIPQVIKNKVVYVSTDGQYDVVADIGGGYLRIYDNKKCCYVDLQGNDVRNYTNQRGKQQGRKKNEQQALTHFRILKKEEM